ncbi:MAG: hypothetical protein ACYS0E_08440 [Planctomycetota bacterium]|jgi:hypothetical protein
MIRTLFPTILATLALVGVIVVFVQQPETSPRTIRESAPADPEIGKLREKIARLEKRVLELENAPAPEPRVVERVAERRDPSEQPPARTTRDRSSRRLAGMIEAGEIGQLTDEQTQQVETALGEARTKLLSTLREIRRNPANEGLSREQLTELVQTEVTALKTHAVDELSAIVPAADAETIVDKLFSARSNRRGRGGRRNR